MLVAQPDTLAARRLVARPDTPAARRLVARPDTLAARRLVARPDMPVARRLVARPDMPVARLLAMRLPPVCSASDHTIRKPEPIWATMASAIPVREPTEVHSAAIHRGGGLRAALCFR
jgi:hypothetical protein